jgi:predicted Zn-dependent protease
MNVIAAVLLLGSLAVAAQEPSARGLNFSSVQRERELGREAAANLQRALPIVHEPKLDAYIAQLGATLPKYASLAATLIKPIWRRLPGLMPNAS